MRLEQGLDSHEKGFEFYPENRGHHGVLMPFLQIGAESQGGRRSAREPLPCSLWFILKPYLVGGGGLTTAGLWFSLWFHIGHSAGSELGLVVQIFQGLAWVLKTGTALSKAAKLATLSSTPPVLGAPFLFAATSLGYLAPTNSPFPLILNGSPFMVQPHWALQKFSFSHYPPHISSPELLTPHLPPVCRKRENHSSLTGSWEPARTPPRQGRKA